MLVPQVAADYAALSTDGELDWTTQLIRNMAHGH
jgi:hypothetical protein